jgi:hypothetical protein
MLAGLFLGRAIVVCAKREARTLRNGFVKSLGFD